MPMFDFSQNRAVLGALYVQALGHAFFRYRNPRRRASGRHLAAFYDQVWREAADRLGASFTSLGSGISEIRLGRSRVRVIENTCPIDDPVTLAVASDKVLTYRLLQAQGLPVPRHAAFTFKTVGRAVEFLDATAGDCVVKPAGGTGGGRGVTTGIRARWQLARAAALAAVYGDELLIEEQKAGDNYRLLYLDGQLLDAFTRNPPTVVADGRSTVGRLVDQANEARLKYGSNLSQVLLTIDLDMKRSLDKQGLSLRSVPAEGRVVIVKTVVNENCGTDNISAAHVLCDAIVEAGARAADALGVRLAGIDVITSDPSVALVESGGVILEVNTPPNYYYHYHKRDGVYPVAFHVLERLFRDAQHAPTVAAALLVGDQS